MSKIMIIGDIHGKSDWIKYATEALKAGIEVVFLGDYVDSFDKKPWEIEQNLLRIIAFKKKADKRKAWITKVTLLLGNHDYSYIMGKFNTSGYDAVWAEKYREIFNKNWNLFDLAWGHFADFTREYTLVTHAGLTETYWKNYISRKELPHYEFVQKILGEDAFDKKPIHKILNVLKDKFGLLWKIGDHRGGSGTPGLLWADLSELIDDPMPGINQIVGHTGWHSPEYLRINNDENFIMKIDGEGHDAQRLIMTL